MCVYVVDVSNENEGCVCMFVDSHGSVRSSGSVVCTRVQLVCFGCIDDVIAV